MPIVIEVAPKEQKKRKRSRKGTADAGLRRLKPLPGGKIPYHPRYNPDPEKRPKPKKPRKPKDPKEKLPRYTTDVHERRKKREAWLKSLKPEYPGERAGRPGARKKRGPHDRHPPKTKRKRMGPSAGRPPKKRPRPMSTS